MSQGGTLDSALPVRTCVACRARASRTELLRFVGRAGELIPDSRKCLPGRGAWVHPSCLDTAIERRAFNRALRGRVTAPTTQPLQRGQTPESGLEADGHPMSTQR